ncbi:hypothetical protein [Halorarius litoreus]|uniref:hypothetical protein n=1 Tax=Halorarius litoreus TaxID=2962676 RepID=UPI0020CE2484|nr:hypothetical protein [Halorarius litoreus]
MNKLAPLGDDRWQLAPHAHVIVHETEDGGEFLTIYDCGAAQKPPSAQLIGNLVRVDAAHELLRQPTGYIAKLREDAMLVRQDDDHFVIRAHEPEGV